MFDEPAITNVLGKSILTQNRFFALSALTKNDLHEVATIRDTLWSTDKKSREFARDLTIISLNFPWAENPAHSLFVSAIEQWSPHDLEVMLIRALNEAGGARAATSNAHLAEVLDGLSDPSSLGSPEFREKLRYQNAGRVMRPLIRAYILDSISQAPERRKLGLTRALTTQDRYELLASIWRCQQGLTQDPSPQKHTRLWVIIDNIEHMLDYTPIERKLLAKELFTILSHLQSYFTLWLNIAETDEKCIKEIKKVCGASLLENLDTDLTESRAV
jgi:hypothetical protein